MRARAHGGRSGRASPAADALRPAAARLAAALFWAAALSGAAPGGAGAVNDGAAPSAGRLPGAAAMAPWTQAGEPRVIPAADLWQHIDGAAEQYISFGCSLLTVGDYELVGGAAELTVEIYAFTDELGCFGLYALERPGAGPFLPLGAQGYQAGGELNFLGGRHYVKLRVYPEGAGEIEEVHRVARVLAAERFAGATFPAELSVFPGEDLVPDSFGFAPRSALGLKGLDRALIARYRRADADLTIHLVRASGGEGADATRAAVVAALRGRSTAPLGEVQLGGATAVLGELRHQGRVLVLQRGGDVVVATGAVDREWAHRVIEHVPAAPAGR